MGEEVHDLRGGSATILKLFCYRRLHLIQLVCTWRIWACEDASQLCLLEHLEHVTHPTPAYVFLPRFDSSTLP